MKSSVPASLQNLNDIVLPATVNWWPVAVGWYFLSGLALIAVVWFGYLSLRRWSDNRYRRVALRELQTLAERMQAGDERDASLRQLPVLLKRTALAAYPRKQVASLTGKDWFQFLNSTAGSQLFTGPAASTLSKVSYSSGRLDDVDEQATAALLHAGRQWLKLHQPSAQSTEGGGT